MVMRGSTIINVAVVGYDSVMVKMETMRADKRFAKRSTLRKETSSREKCLSFVLEMAITYS